MNRHYSGIPKDSPVLAFSVFILAGFLVYLNTFNSPFIFDDFQNILLNPHIRMTSITPEGIAEAFKGPCMTRPLANLSFALNYYFGQYNVQGYHLVNIIIHILNGILLYLLFKATLSISNSSTFIDQRKTENHPPDYFPVIPFLAALLWLVHPLHTQSVTYIVQRMNSMAAMFYMLSLLLYIKGRMKQNSKTDRRDHKGATGNQRLYFAGCLLSGILAAGSKETVATLPFFIFLYEWYFFQDLNPAWAKRHFKWLGCAFILFAVMAAVFLGGNPLASILSGYETRDFTLNQRVLTQFRVVVYFISLLFYPNPGRLNLDYNFSLSDSLFDPIATLFSLCVIIGLVWLAVYTAKKNRLLSFGIFWFLGNLVIESSLIALEIIYEHRTYLPSMFIFLPAAATVCRHIHIPVPASGKRQPMRKARLAAGTGIFCVIALLLSIWTYQRNSVWQDAVSLWTDNVKKSEGKARPLNNLGMALFEEGRFEEAIVRFYDALRIKPDYVKAHSNLGVALIKRGRLKDAAVHLNEALRIRPNYEIYTNLGNVFFRQGDIKEALDMYRKALRTNPGAAEPHNNLGVALCRYGRVEDAIIHFRKALRIMPYYEDAQINLEKALRVVKDFNLCG